MDVIVKWISSFLLPVVFFSPSRHPLTASMPYVSGFLTRVKSAYYEFSKELVFSGGDLFCPDPPP